MTNKAKNHPTRYAKKKERLINVRKISNSNGTIAVVASTQKKDTYTFSSIFPNEEIMQRAFKILYDKE